jgi:hypothetical protein
LEGILGIGGGIVATMLTILLIILAVLWVLLPFAVFGLKRKLESIRELSERTNKLLEQVSDHLLGLRKDIVRSTAKSKAAAQPGHDEEQST